MHTAVGVEAKVSIGKKVAVSLAHGVCDKPCDESMSWSGAYPRLCGAKLGSVSNTNRMEVAHRDSLPLSQPI